LPFYRPVYRPQKYPRTFYAALLEGGWYAHPAGEGASQLRAAQGELCSQREYSMEWGVGRREK
jgi:hypothetical protein